MGRTLQKLLDVLKHLENIGTLRRTVCFLENSSFKMIWKYHGINKVPLGFSAFIHFFLSHLRYIGKDELLFCSLPFTPSVLSSSIFFSVAWLHLCANFLISLKEKRWQLSCLWTLFSYLGDGPCWLFTYYLFFFSL